MTFISPGDWVECVRTGPCGVRLFTIGAVYQVADLTRDERPCRCPDSHLDRGLIFHGRPTPDAAFGTGWCARNFRPIYRPKSSIIEALKAPVSLPEEVAVTRPAPAERSPREPLRAKG